jgi:hypothetical protein
MSAKQPKPKTQTPVQVSAEIHRVLIDIANQRAVAESRKVSIREVLEEAVRAHYPQAAMTTSAPGALIAPASDIQSSAIMAQLIDIVMLEPDPIAQSRRIEALEGAISGSFGQAIRLRDLAYCLRSAEAPIDGLQSLIAVYEGGEGGSSAQ